MAHYDTPKEFAEEFKVPESVVDAHTDGTVSINSHHTSPIPDSEIEEWFKERGYEYTVRKGKWNDAEFVEA